MKIGNPLKQVIQQAQQEVRSAGEAVKKKLPAARPTVPGMTDGFELPRGPAPVRLEGPESPGALARAVGGHGALAACQDGTAGNTALPRSLGEVGTRAKDLLLSSETWGRSMSVDTGTGGPRPFGYGTLKNTLLEASGKHVLEDKDELNIGSRKPVAHVRTEAEARARLFGDACLDTLSASIGGELEVGVRRTREEVRAPSSPRPASRQEEFIGLQARGFGEVGPLGGGTGGEAFLGYTRHETLDSGAVGTREGWRHQASQLDLGVRAGGQGNLGIASSVLGHMEAGARYRYTDTTHQPLGTEGLPGADKLPKVEGAGVMQSFTVNAFVGALAEAGASMNPLGAEAGGELFVGAKAGITVAGALAREGQELIGLAATLEGRVGLGVEARASVGFDPKEREVKAEGRAGVAVGLGVSVGAGVTLGGEALTKTLADELKPT